MPVHKAGFLSRVVLVGRRAAATQAQASSKWIVGSTPALLSCLPAADEDVLLVRQRADMWGLQPAPRSAHHRRLGAGTSSAGGNLTQIPMNIMTRPNDRYPCRPALLRLRTLCDWGFGRDDDLFFLPPDVQPAIDGERLRVVLGEAHTRLNLIDADGRGDVLVVERT